MEDLAKYAGQKVIVTVNLTEANEKGETSVELEGTAQSANELGILLKPKGKTSVKLIEASQIERVQFAPEEAKALKAKPLQPVKYGNARQHLADRHGVPLADVNQLSEESALSYHEDVEHDQTVISHFHQEKKADEAAPAAE